MAVVPQLRPGTAGWVRREVRIAPSGNARLSAADGILEAPFSGSEEQPTLGAWAPWDQSQSWCGKLSMCPNMLVTYLGVAEVETILFDGPFTAIAASTARSFTGRLRRAIEVRDRHCQHPSGCDVPASECDVDHIVAVADGGETSQFNGRLECRPHNRDAAKHDHGATPHPQRPVTVLDEIRARLRWHHLHNDNDGDDPDHVTKWRTGGGKPRSTPWSGSSSLRSDTRRLTSSSRSVGVAVALVRWT